MNKKQDNSVVYEWSIDGDVIYYIGIGGLDRACNMSENARNIRWSAITQQYNNEELLVPVIENKLYKAGRIQLKILHDNLTDREALKIEGELIAKYGRIGFDKGGILTNLQIGHGKGDDREDRYCTPINQYKLDGTYVATYKDETSVYIPGEKLLIGLCTAKHSNGTYKQLASGGFQWRFVHDPNINGNEDIAPYAGQPKGGNSTTRAYFKVHGENFMTQGQRKIGFKLGGVKLLKKYEVGLLNLSEDETLWLNSKAEKVSKDVFKQWKKNNRDIYNEYEAHFKLSYEQYKQSKKRARSSR